MPAVASGVPASGSGIPGAARAGAAAKAGAAAQAGAAARAGAAAQAGAAAPVSGELRCPESLASLSELRAELLGRVRVAAAAQAARCQDADLAEELASWGAAGGPVAPSVEELYGLVPDPDCGPPDRSEAWLADLPGPLLFEYLDAVAGPAGPEPIAAGRLPRGLGNGYGFAAGGVADDLPPGPVLAGLADSAWSAGLGQLTDDELIGVLRAGRRLASWAAALELAVVADLAARRQAAAQAAGDGAVIEHLGDEVAAALTLTGRAADGLLDLAYALQRLPATAAALAAGRIDRYKAAVIAEETSGLSDEHAAAVESAALTGAPSQTTGQLRAATRRAVLAADPAAARRRKERALREARVERWDEHTGTAALAGRDLPPATVLAADQNLTALARSLKHAGVPGTMDQLRAQVYLALLTGQPVSSMLPPVVPAPQGTAGPAPAGPAGDVTGLTGGPAGLGAGQGLAGEKPGLGQELVAQKLGLAGQGLAGSVNLTMPLATWLGLSDAPGDAAGFGSLDADDSRDLAALLAQWPGNRWCITLTGQNGRPVAHGCTRTRPPPSAMPSPPAGPSPPAEALTWLAGITISALETGQCTHQRQSAAYRPPPSLQHLITIRQATCSYPGCRRPAIRCDQEHTIPHGQGGRTCECNLAPICRRHHRCKQTQGWRLVQPEPGVMIWTLPHGRSYRVDPEPYLDS